MPGITLHWRKQAVGTIRRGAKHEVGLKPNDLSVAWLMARFRQMGGRETGLGVADIPSPSLGETANLRILHLRNRFVTVTSSVVTGIGHHVTLEFAQKTMS